MRLLFLSLLDFSSFEERNIYTDLLREFIKNGHEVYCISPAERRTGIKTHFEENGHLLRVRIGNTQKTNIIEKGISTLMIEKQFVAAIRKYYSDLKFDLVLYATPPITFSGAIKYVKKRDGAKTYLMLKDIFPQNAVDLGIMKTTGLKGLIYKYFRHKEKKLYALSDSIGCMSEANMEYLLRHNPEVSRKCVEICPNSIEPIDMLPSQEQRIAIRTKYGIPLDKKVFVYGGNLGKPQGIPFLIDCLRSQKDNKDVFFLVVGYGTEYGRLRQFIEKERPENVKLMKQLPKDDYDKMIAVCDIGMIFLDHRFTIPNFPSRLLPYMQARLPVLAVTDPTTDIGQVAVSGKFGWRCESNNVEEFHQRIREITLTDDYSYKNNAWEYLCDFYSVHNTYLRCFAPLDK